MGQIIAGVCLSDRLSVCLSVVATVVAILNTIWWSFARSLGSEN